MPSLARFARTPARVLTSSSREAVRIVCFDLDGTLIPRSSVSLFLAGILRQEALLHDLEERFRRREISNAAIADATAAAFRGMAISEVDAMLSRTPLVGGIEETVAALKRHGMKVLLCTITWSFAARAFQRRYGFDAICGTVMDEAGGCLTGAVARHFHEYDKLAFVEAYCREQGISPMACAAVGDSRSDIPLFAKVGRAIAFNGTAEAKAAAHATVDGDDLTAVLPHLLS